MGIGLVYFIFMSGGYIGGRENIGNSSMKLSVLHCLVCGYVCNGLVSNMSV